MLKFTSTIDIRIGNPFVLVSAEQAKAIKPGWKKPMPVLVQINGAPNPPWRINMMPVGDGSFYLYLHGDVRKASNTKVGDKVEVKFTFHKEYKNGPMHPMPDWFQNALAKNAKAKKNWEALIPSRQKEILRYFSWLKSDEAIERNLKKVMDMLSGKPTRFLARDWKDGK